MRGITVLLLASAFSVLAANGADISVAKISSSSTPAEVTTPERLRRSAENDENSKSSSLHPISAYVDNAVRAEKRKKRSAQKVMTTTEKSKDDHHSNSHENSEPSDASGDDEDHTPIVPNPSRRRKRESDKPKSASVEDTVLSSSTPAAVTALGRMRRSAEERSESSSPSTHSVFADNAKTAEQRKKRSAVKVSTTMEKSHDQQQDNDRKNSEQSEANMGVENAVTKIRRRKHNDAESSSAEPSTTPISMGDKKITAVNDEPASGAPQIINPIENTRKRRDMDEEEEHNNGGRYRRSENKHKRPTTGTHTSSGDVSSTTYRSARSEAPKISI